MKKTHISQHISSTPAVVFHIEITFKTKYNLVDTETSLDKEHQP